MELKQNFSNVFSYAAGMEDWVNKSLPYGPLRYTFVSDFSIADWYGVDGVKETYERVKAEWLDNVEAFTEVVIALNMLSWAHDTLKQQGIDERDDFICLYSDLYLRAKDDFYDRHGSDDDACDYFFRMTD